MRRELEPFRFKQFSVSHKNATIPVGTDAVLLSAWVDVASVNHALDVGTGCGLISLGVSQRLKGDFEVHALDIDFESVRESQENFKESPWSENLTAFHSMYQNHKIGGYDLIISNPPFFRNSQKNGDDFLEKARHQVSFEMNDFARYCYCALTSFGKVALVYPAQDLDFLKSCFLNVGFFVSRICTVYSKESKSPSRVLIEFKKQTVFTKEGALVIYTSENEYTSAYKELTKDFYLNF